MKNLSLLALLFLCASAAMAAAPHPAADTAARASAPGVSDAGAAPEVEAPVCPDPGASPSVGLTPAPAPQAPNPCIFDCREDYGACLISTPKYICYALYQACLSNC